MLMMLAIHNLCNFLLLERMALTKKQRNEGCGGTSTSCTGDEMEKSGNRWYGCVLLDDNMIRSMAVMDFPSQNELPAWLKREPYVTGDIWKTIEVYKCKVKNPWKFNRSQSFFELREK